MSPTAFRREVLVDLVSSVNVGTETSGSSPFAKLGKSAGSEEKITMIKVLKKIVKIVQICCI